MKLLELHIHQLPGLDSPTHIEKMEAGTNLVLGPNAIGKSSLIRAMALVLEVDPRQDPRAVSISARFSHDGQDWTASRSGSDLSWTREGQPAEPPPLPRRDQLRCYWLSMEDLAAADRKDDSLVRALQQALAGGYDLKALSEQEPFRVRPRLGTNEAGRLRQARRALAKVEADYASLRRQEIRLPELEKERDQAVRARQRIESLKRALELLEARENLEGIAAELDQWPEAMEKLRGNELEVLDKLTGRLASIEDGIRKARDMESRARQKLEATGLQDRAPESALLKTLAGNLDSLQRAQDRHRILMRDLEDCKTGEATAREQLGETGPAPRLEPGAVSGAEELARELHEARTRLESLSREIERTPSKPEPAQIETHREAVSALREWLATHSAGNARARTAAVIAAAAALATGSGSLLVDQPLIALGCGLALVAAGWAVFECLPGRNSRPSRDRFDRTRLQAPEGWSRPAVETRLTGLESRLRELDDRDSAAARAEFLKPELEDARKELETLQGRRNDLASELGFDPELAAAGLDRFIRLSQAWHKAHTRRRSLERELETLDRETGQTRTEITRTLSEWGYEAVETRAMIAAFDDLNRRREQAEEARRDLGEAGRQVEELTRQSKDCLRERRELLERLGLEPEEEHELARWIEQLPRWIERNKSFHEARGAQARVRKQLEEDPDLLEKVQTEPVERVRARIREDMEAARDKADGADELIEEIRSIRQSLAEAGRKGTLEAAVAAVETSRAELEDRHRETLAAEAATFLLESVREEFQAENEPPALAHARELFGRFTHGGWALDLDDEQGLMAINTASEARRGLSELSTGTRIQLLLAVRLAWTRRLEQHTVALPIFLDEALTTTDEDRFSRVATSLQELADGEGRQVFYLSARRHERVLWEQATGHKPRVIDLAAIRFGTEAEQDRDFSLPETEPVPRPEGRSPEDYARVLAVAPIRPIRPAGSIHVFHLLRDDLDTLWELMENWRIAHLGALEKLLDSPSAENAIKAPALRRSLADRCRVTRHWLAACEHGRSRPVDRGVLEESGQITPAFIDPVALVADEAGNDPEVLMERLEEGAVSGFGPARLGALSEWLHEEGYLDERDPLDSDQRLRRVLDACADTVAPADIRKVASWLEAGLLPAE